MAKKRSRRFNLRKVHSTPAQALGTLGGVTVVKTALFPAADGAYRLVSAQYIWSVLGLTDTEGPITVGYCHSDYTVTEVKECIEAQAAISLGDKVAQEQANRLVRIVGEISTARPVLNDGRPVKTKLNWLITIGDTPEVFAYNNNSGALTTGAVHNASGIGWVKDSS